MSDFHSIFDMSFNLPLYGNTHLCLRVTWSTLRDFAMSRDFPGSRCWMPAQDGGPCDPCPWPPMDCVSFWSWSSPASPLWPWSHHGWSRDLPLCPWHLSLSTPGLLLWLEFLPQPKKNFWISQHNTLILPSDPCQKNYEQLNKLTDIFPLTHWHLPTFPLISAPFLR